jgi:RND family efflux transporter MFP subunit
MMKNLFLKSVTAVFFTTFSLWAAGCGHPAVTVMNAHISQEPLTIEDQAKPEALHSAPVIPTVSGNLSTNPPDVGTAVKAGQVLFTVDSSHYEAEVQELESRIAASAGAGAAAAAVSAPAESGVDMSHESQLLSQGIITRAEYERIQSKKSASLPVAGSSASGAESPGQANAGDMAALQAAQKAVSDCTVRSPIDGVISQSYIGDQKVALAGKPALVIRQDSPVVAEITVMAKLKNALEQAKTQKTLTVSMTDGSRTWYGELKQQPQGEEDSLLLCRLQFDNGDDQITIGQPYTVRIETQQNVPAFVIPKSAFIKPNMVAVVTGDHLIDMKTVRVASAFGDSRIVIDGLSEGDQVVIDPPQGLQIGQQVTVK